MSLLRAVHDPCGGHRRQGARLPPPGQQLWAASRQTLLPGHCGHLSHTGQMPRSQIFAPQNTEAETCDSLLLPSFYRVDKKICWLLSGIQMSQHFLKSLSNTAVVLYISKVRQNSPKRGLKSILNISGNYSALEQYLQPFAVWASLSVSSLLLHN